MRVIGTAGHVDHGKSTLVHALTGIDPDRLREEKEREMTIDLGFAWLTLPPAVGEPGAQGELVGVIDVPGHIDFIKNMLAGVGGIDAAVFVVAADEGVMPQTREHLAILDLLQVPAGVVALTKIDAVTEEGWLDLVEADLRDVFSGTCWRMRPSCRVSARTSAGLPALKQAMADVLATVAPRMDKGQPRLPIDRAFSVAGFGTVVTGTLSDGAFRVGDEVEIVPPGLQARIRGLQSHKKAVELGLPGSRLAINLTGVHPDDLARGMVIARPGTLRPTTWWTCGCDWWRAAGRGARWSRCATTRRWISSAAPPRFQPTSGCWMPRRFGPAQRAGRNCGWPSRWWLRAATVSSSARRRPA